MNTKTEIRWMVGHTSPYTGWMNIRHALTVVKRVGVLWMRTVCITEELLVHVFLVTGVS